jgi:hypothetical protein
MPRIGSGACFGESCVATIELYPPRPRPRVQAATTRGPSPGGNQSVKIVKPNNTDPIPLRTSSPKMGTIMLRFVALLLVAVAVLALLWNR